MLRFYADRFHEATNMMGALKRELRDEKGKYIGPKLHEQCCKYLGDLSQACEEMHLLVSKKAIDHVRELMNSPPVRVDQSLQFLMSHTYRTINDELSLAMLFSVKPEHAKFYDPPTPLFGQQVANKFPSALNEIDEAGKCFALSRFTACVFHLMRILEIGIESVRKSLGIPDPVKDADRNWGAILRKLNDELSRRNTPPLQWPNATDKEFFAEVYASLDAVRNVWRNATMHVEKTYGEEQAEHIFAAVRGFMGKLAKRVDEKGQPSA